MQSLSLISDIEYGMERGWIFTPLNGKVPVRRNWQGEEPVSVDALMKHVERGGNVGLRCGSASGVIVLDIDTDKGGQIPPGLPKTITVETGGGGLHLYFDAPEVPRVQNSVGKIAPHVDIRAEGGQVVYPGSKHPDTGKPYRWKAGHSPRDLDLAPFPTHLIRKPEAKQQPPARPRGEVSEPYLRAALGGEVDNLVSTPEGQRNHQLNRAAFALGQLVSHGLSESEITEALVSAVVCDTFTEAEARKTVASGIRSGMASPREIEIRTYGNGKHRDRTPPLGSREPKIHLLKSDHPLRLAESYLDEQRRDADGRLTLRRFREEWYAYARSAYIKEPREAVRADIYAHLDRTWIDGMKPHPLKVNAQMVTEVEGAIPSRDALVNAEPPAWLRGDGTQPEAQNILACAKGLLYLPTQELLDSTPEFFTLNALDYSYQPDAPEPKEFLSFLESIWGDDSATIGTLQEWFGYCLTPDTRQHKILMVVGPPRAGKGVIARVMKALLGSRNVCSPTLAGLGGNFGREPLLGKTLAIISDARISARTDSAIVCERLLSISGEDNQTVDRKFKLAIDGPMPIKFMLMTNELPRVTDASGALVSRYIVLPMERSFIGREDIGLTDRLLEELPGILNWAIKGWDRLQERGRFIQPEAGKASIQELEDLNAPVRAFVRQRLEVAHSYEAPVKAVFAEWQKWCEDVGRKAGNVQVFGKNLRACVPTLRLTHPRLPDGTRVSTYEGVKIADNTV